MTHATTFYVTTPNHLRAILTSLTFFTLSKVEASVLLSKGTAHIIPTLGMKYSQPGNKTFPHWE